MKGYTSITFYAKVSRVSRVSLFGRVGRVTKGPYKEASRATLPSSSMQKY
jgi:hypothetical protein